MRVLHVGKYYPPVSGGIEVFTADLCRAQARAGHHVLALVHGDASAASIDEGVEIRRVSVSAEVLFTPISPSFRRSLATAIREFRPDVIHIHVPNPSALWLLTLASARRIPWVVHWHSDIVASTIDRRLRLAYALYRPFERRLLARAARILATSPPYLETSDALKPWRERCTVVPLGIDVSRYGKPGLPQPAWPGDGQGDGHFRILAVGRLTYYKGFETLVRAVARTDGSLVIVGHGAEHESIEAAARSSGCIDRVHLIDNAGDALRNAYFESCDVVCQPSLERTEAFGIVLLEAFAFRKPVVASSIPGSGAPWVVATSGAGLVTPPGDVAALAGALQDLREHPARAKALGRAGRKALGERFSIDAVRATIDAIYADLPAPGA